MTTTARVLVTGFEPFGGDDTNPSGQLVERLADTHPGVVLPVEFRNLRQRVNELMEQWRPTHVVSLGLSARATGITYERVALNLIDAPIADNAEQQPVDVPVVEGGPDALWVGLPVKEMMAATRAVDVPAELSLSAGAYVCNALLYTLLTEAGRRPEGDRPRCGFVHVPPVATLDLDSQERGLRAALNVLTGDAVRR